MSSIRHLGIHAFAETQPSAAQQLRGTIKLFWKHWAIEPRNQNTFQRLKLCLKPTDPDRRVEELRRRLSEFINALKVSVLEAPPSALARSGRDPKRADPVAALRRPLDTLRSIAQHLLVLIQITLGTFIEDNDSIDRSYSGSW